MANTLSDVTQTPAADDTGVTTVDKPVDTVAQDIDLDEEFDLFDEVQTVKTVKKTPVIIRVSVVPENEKITSSNMNLYEYTKALGIRISMIEMGSPICIDYKGLTSAQEIAKKELMMRKSPLILTRVINEINGIRYVEKYKVSEMTYII